VTGVRAPVVVGLSRCLGTSTLAAALHATDGGLLAAGTAGEADAVLCRADEPSLRHAALLACAPGGPRPVLVPVGPGAAPPAPAVGFGAVVVLPHVRRWAGTPDVRGEAAAVLAFPPEQLPLEVRAYAAALHGVVRALTGSELLHRTTPPLVSRPTTARLWRGLQPLARPVAAVPTLLRARPEPDDEALEAGRVR
jgi:hypothetical protein